MQRRTLIFEEPGRIAVKREELPAGRPGQVLIAAEISAVSAGTELLFFRGQVPSDIPMDASIPELNSEMGYPLRYGYQMVGRIIESNGGHQDLLGARAFAFHPHQSHFWLDPEQLVVLPETLDSEDAVFLANMETAVNFAHDGRPLLGERVLVLGQGIVGLLTTALLGTFPLAQLVTVDRQQNRRQISRELGADASLDPMDEDGIKAAIAAGLGIGETATPDLIFEVSGNPAALRLAISLSGYQSRLIVGSWYGSKPTEIDFGGSFHRNRVEIKSSQVSSIDPSLLGRWNKERRLATALDQLERIHPARLISHRFEFAEAMKAYQLLDQGAENAFQIVFDYHNED